MSFFGSTIKHLRESKGLSREELAKLMDYHRTNLTNIEAGRKQASKEFINKLSRALGIDVSKLKACVAIDEYGEEVIKAAFQLLNGSRQS